MIPNEHIRSNLLPPTSPILRTGTGGGGMWKLRPMISLRCASSKQKLVSLFVIDSFSMININMYCAGHRRPSLSSARVSLLSCLQYCTVNPVYVSLFSVDSFLVAYNYSGLLPCILLPSVSLCLILLCLGVWFHLQFRCSSSPKCCIAIKLCAVF